MLAIRKGRMRLHSSSLDEFSFICPEHLQYCIEGPHWLTVVQSHPLTNEHRICGRDALAHLGIPRSRRNRIPRAGRGRLISPVATFSDGRPRIVAREFISSRGGIRQGRFDRLALRKWRRHEPCRRLSSRVVAREWFVSSLAGYISALIQAPSGLCENRSSQCYQLSTNGMDRLLPPSAGDSLQRLYRSNRRSSPWDTIILPLGLDRHRHWQGSLSTSSALVVMAGLPFVAVSA
jgi:hypothetical protein